MIHILIVETYNSATYDMKQKIMSSMKGYYKIRSDQIRSDQIRMRDKVRGGQVII